MLDQVKNKGELRPYLRNVNVRWGNFDLSDLAQMRVTSEEAEQLAVCDGDLFICEGGEPGRAAVWRGGTSNLVFQKALHRVRPHAMIDPDFIAAYLDFSARQGLLADFLTGTTIKHLPQDALSRISLPLAPANEQRRIVAKLDELTARLARVRAELENAVRLVSHLKATAVAAIFGGDERHRAPLSAVLVDIRYGTAKKCDYEGGATPVLRIPNVQNGKVRLENLKFANFDTKELGRLALDPGDILIIRSNGSISLVGSSAVVSEAERGMLYAGYLIRLRLNQAHCLPEYLQFFLQSKSARSALESAARSTSGVHNINTAHLRALVLPLPDIKAQSEAVKQLQAAFARADHIEAEAARATALLDRLEASVLAKAFRGKLVPQDLEDEPASALLDRIRAERAASPKAGRRRGAAGRAEAR